MMSSEELLFSTMPSTSVAPVLNRDHQKVSPQIQGIVTPMVTPLLGRDELDLAGLERLTNRLIEGGVSAIFLLGTTGEFASMTHQMRCGLVVRTMQLVRCRVPVFVGISDTSLEESLWLAHCAAENGARACVVTAPYYYRPNEPLMGDYLIDLASRSPLPLILYNMPENTGVNFDLKTIQRIVGHPGFIGIKDSGGNLAYFEKVCAIAQSRPDFSVLMGPDKLLGQALQKGASGGVNSGSNLCPELFVGLYHASLRGDTATVKKFEDKIDLLNQIYAVPQQSLGVPCGLKTALAELGVCSDYMIPPYRSADELERKTIHEIVRQLCS